EHRSDPRRARKMAAGRIDPTLLREAVRRDLCRYGGRFSKAPGVPEVHAAAGSDAARDARDARRAGPDAEGAAEGRSRLPGPARPEGAAEARGGGPRCDPQGDGGERRARAAADRVTEKEQGGALQRRPGGRGGYSREAGRA